MWGGGGGERGVSVGVLIYSISDSVSHGLSAVVPSMVQTHHHVLL